MTKTEEIMELIHNACIERQYPQTEVVGSGALLKAAIEELVEKLASSNALAVKVHESWLQSMRIVGDVKHEDEELSAKLTEQKLVIMDHEMADYKGEVAELKAKLAVGDAS